MRDLARSTFLRETFVRAIEHGLVEVVALWRRDLEVDAESRVRDHHLVENVVRVSDPRDRESLERREVGREGLSHFEERLEVGEDLGRVVQVRERVDDGNGRVGGESLS